MPGRSEPYLPDNADYAIPYKDQITIRQLLSQRAGVFDVSNQSVPIDSPLPYAGCVQDLVESHRSVTVLPTLRHGAGSNVSRALVQPARGGCGLPRSPAA